MTRWAVFAAFAHLEVEAPLAAVSVFLDQTPLRRTPLCPARTPEDKRPSDRRNAAWPENKMTITTLPLLPSPFRGLRRCEAQLAGFRRSAPPPRPVPPALPPGWTAWTGRGLREP